MAVHRLVKQSEWLTDFSSSWLAFLHSCYLWQDKKQLHWRLDSSLKCPMFQTVPTMITVNRYSVTPLKRSPRKCMTVFARRPGGLQTWPLGRNCYHYLLLRLERKQKNSSNPFRIGIFLFLSYSFWIETINTFIHSRSSLENHTRFETKMGKVYDYPFSDQNGAKTLPDGAAHSYIAYTREFPSGCKRTQF